MEDKKPQVRVGTVDIEDDVVTLSAAQILANPPKLVTRPLPKAVETAAASAQPQESDARRF